MTPGYKTTELYLTLAAHLVAAFLAMGIFPDTHVAVKVAAFAAAALAAMGYTASRAFVKAGAVKPAEGPRTVSVEVPTFSGTTTSTLMGTIQGALEKAKPGPVITFEGDQSEPPKPKGKK